MISACITLFCLHALQTKLLDASTWKKILFTHNRLWAARLLILIKKMTMDWLGSCHPPWWDAQPIASCSSLVMKRFAFVKKGGPRARVKRPLASTLHFSHEFSPLRTKNGQASRICQEGEMMRKWATEGGGEFFAFVIIPGLHVSPTGAQCFF